MRTMYDSTSASSIPTTAQMVAGYIDHPYYTWSATDWGRFPNAVKVRIAVKATTNDGHVLDVETGDATPAQAVSWVKMRRAAGADPTVYLAQYLTGYSWADVKNAFAAAGVAEPHYWIANWNGSPTVMTGAVAHQYAQGDDPTGAQGPYSGGHYDLSAVLDYWPGVDGVAPPPPVPSSNYVLNGAGINIRNQPYTTARIVAYSKTNGIFRAQNNKYLAPLNAIFKLSAWVTGTNIGGSTRWGQFVAPWGSGVVVFIHSSLVHAV